MTTYTIHDFRSGMINEIAFEPGDYTIHDYGRGPEVGIVTVGGHVHGVPADHVPFDVSAVVERFAAVEDEINAAIAEALAPFTTEWDYSRTVDDFLAGTGRM